MKISIVVPDSVVCVDGIGRSVDVTELRATIHAVQFDTTKSVGHVEFSTELSPRQENQEITDFSPYQVFVDRWTAAAPPAPLPPRPSPAYDWDDVTRQWVLNPDKQAELDRLAAIDSDISAQAIGIASPATAAQLKAMTLAEYSAWFDANFDTAGKLIGLLKRLTLIVIRRAL